MPTDYWGHPLPARDGWIEKPAHTREEIDTAKAKKALWERVKREVMKRDGRKCRCCGSREQVDPHHIKFKSAGGGDSTKNVAAICRVCHDDIHAYRLAVVGTDANKPLKFVRRA